NHSSGKTGVLLASELVSAGAKVTFIYGLGIEAVPKGVKVIRVETGQEMLNAVRKEMRQKFDIVILAAAVSDYTVERPSKMKIKSDHEKIVLKLKRVPKIINQIKKIQKDVFLVGFKTETNILKEKLINLARKKLKESNADLIVANDIGLKKYRDNPNYNNVIIINSNKIIQSGWKKKLEIVRFIRKEIEEQMSS
ncbi:MAG TPA: phosphopantothenoylcysteine decarboxylase, partial [Nitrosopumilaceae archaeon]|nr:phosphopantothenoylcysteine decarboxylase [Nitrosopumilaceae archaeon]